MEKIFVDKKMISSGKTRIQYLDIAKAIGILCIIAGHMGIAVVDKIVFTFHVPLFLLISGYFLNRSEDIILFTKKAAKSLLIPYYFTGLCLILVKIPIDIIHEVPNQILNDIFCTLLQVLYASGTNMNNTIGGITQIGAIWFFWALFWAEIITKAALELKYRGGVFLVLFALVAYYTSLYVWLPLNIQAGVVSSIFVYLGAILRERQVLEILDWKFFFIGVIALVLEVYFGIYLHVVSNTYVFGIVSMIGAVLISGFIIEVSKYIEKISAFKGILLFYGQNTKIILCFHLIELNNFPWYRLYNKMQIFEIPLRIQSICVFCVKLILITLCTYITLKIKWLRKVFVKD